MAEEGGALELPPQRQCVIEGGPGQATWWDKVPSKLEGWGEPLRGRRLPRRSGRDRAARRLRRADVVLMPSFVNLGAYVDEETMVDTWATVGSCAQIGKTCHLSGGVGIGGVLEPLQANPTIIEDDCFIGARSEVVEGVVVGEGAVLRWAFSSPPRPRSSTARPARFMRRGAALFGGGGGHPPRQAPARRYARTLDLLRGDHEDGRRPDALEDRDQRAAEGLKGADPIASKASRPSRARA